MLLLALLVGTLLTTVQWLVESLTELRTGFLLRKHKKEFEMKITAQSQLIEVIDKALAIARNLGFKSAAGFLRNRGFTLAEALMMLNLPNRFNIK
jgi:hypothetical protein